MTGIPKPPSFFRATDAIDSAAIQDGTVATADLSTTALYGFTAKTTPVVADSVAIVDSEASNVNKKATLTNIQKALGEVFAGTNASSALSEVDGVGRVNINGTTGKTTPVGADAVLINDSEASNVNKKTTITQLMEVVAGTVTTSGIENTTGVLSIVPASLTGKNSPIGADTLIIADSEATNVAKGTTIAQLAAKMAGSGITSTAEVLDVADVGIAHHLADDKHSLFFISGEIDCGESNPVTVDLGALGSKATLVGGYWYTTEAFANGDATNVITLGSATGGGTPIAGTRTITLANTGDGQSNVIGSMAAIIPVAAGVDMASTAHVWLDVPDDSAGTRSAGKVSVFCIFQKSA